MRAIVTVLALTIFAAPLHAQPATQAASVGPASSTEANRPPPVGQGSNGDWAYVGRYREANTERAAESSQNRVVFMGDSITQAWADQPFIKDQKAFVGRGISGQTASQMLVRFRSDVIDLKPAVVHIMAGTNDVAQNNGPETPTEITGYLTSMVDLAQANRIKVVLASIPPAQEFYWHKGLDPAPKIIALNQWIKAFAAERKLIFVDYWSVLATPNGAMKSDFSGDGVHPNAAGYEAMRPLTEAAINDALARK